MNILFCGAGRLTRELLRRLGESFEPRLVEIDPAVAESLAAAFPHLSAPRLGDASSPVVLDAAGVGEMDYVLALTGSDAVNLAICRHARSCDVRHVVALVNRAENLEGFTALGVTAVPLVSTLAANLAHYLQNPDLAVTPLAMGAAAVMEIEATGQPHLVGQRAGQLGGESWWLSGIVRDGAIQRPTSDTVIHAGDRLLFLGREGSFSPLCEAIACGLPHFPLAWGSGLLLALTANDPAPESLLAEALSLAGAVHVRQVTVAGRPEDKAVAQQLAAWPPSLGVRRVALAEPLAKALPELAAAGSVGAVIIRPVAPGIFSGLTRAPHIDLAKTLGRPLLVARQSHPYERLLVPFNGSPAAEAAMEVAVDIARQIGARVSAVAVEEPAFLHGQEIDGFAARIRERLNELGHIHKMDIEEIITSGNPVHEIVAAAGACDLLVLGAGRREKALFTPHVAELIAGRAPCSVLVVPG